MEEAVIVAIVDGCRCQSGVCGYLRAWSFVGGVKDLVCILVHSRPYFCRDTACIGEFLWTCTGLCFGSGNVSAVKSFESEQDACFCSEGDDGAARLAIDVERCAIQATRYELDRGRVGDDARHCSKDAD